MGADCELMRLKGFSWFIFSQFRKVTEYIPVTQPSIGVLTGQHRDLWAKDYQNLVETHHDNIETFKWIQSALFFVCLDHLPIAKDLVSQARKFMETYIGNVFHGNDAHNRWFDKSLSIIVTNDGRLGVNGEHSPCDALVPAFLVDYSVLNEPAKDPTGTDTGVDADVIPFVHLQWNISGSIKKSIIDAQLYVDKTIADSDIDLMHYNLFGSDFIKSTCIVLV